VKRNKERNMEMLEKWEQREVGEKYFRGGTKS
jgi:hypothetical protein